MEKNSKIYIAGHTGLVGSAIKRELERQKYIDLLTRKSHDLDLRDQRAVQSFFLKERPEYVFFAAAKVGGIKANMEYPADFIYDNIQMQSNIIDSSFRAGVRKLLFFGSNCMYPTDAPQPIKEESLLTGLPEPTNESYAIAKIAGIKMCQAYNEQHGTNFISVIPASLFGPNDNWDLIYSHIIPVLIKKCHRAKLQNLEEVTIDGSENRRRELMHVDDLVNACLFLMENYDSSEIINVGVGRDYSLREIAEMVKEVVGFKRRIIFDSSKPTGMARKFLDSAKINSLGWKAEIELEDGLKRTYEWFKENIAI